VSELISIVLPVYNGERYLRASIDSVLTQSLQDFEFIIWDDASTDSSREIISSYSDPRIRVFENNSNLGLFKTLNLIITNSSGPLIKLWSQDDVMKEDCLSKLTSFLSTQNMAAMAYCAYDLFDRDGKVYKPAPPDQTPETIDPRLAAQIMFYNGSLTGNIANVILRRSALDEVGLFREDMMVSGDFEMWVDWKIKDKGDSGIYLRGTPQVQIWDPSDKPASGVGSGGLYNNQKNPSKPIKKADKPIGEWNTFRIVMKGDNVTVYLNGELVVDNKPLANYFEKGKPLPATGPIELQHHGDKLWFKNIYVKELK